MSLVTPGPAFRSNAQYGWLPDPPDQRDLVYLSKMDSIIRLKRIKKVDLRASDVPIYNQLALGSCTANAIIGMYRFTLRKQGLTDFNGSRLFLYYNERAMEGSVGEDSGAIIRDGLKSINNQGVCSETTWPYNIQIFSQQPPQYAYMEAFDHQALTYLSVPQTLRDMKLCLQAGYQFVFGFSVYESFESDETARTGQMFLPKKTERVLGGHAVRCVGYDNDKFGGSWIVANSWGTGWGDNGYFYMPYKYATNPNLASDFWTIRLVEG